MRFILFLCWLAPLLSKPLQLHLGAESAILICRESGAVLYEKNADQRAFPASLTKIATALYAREHWHAPLDSKVLASAHALTRMSKSVKVAHGYRDLPYLLEPDGTHFSIKKGEELPLIDLLYGILMASGNDASNVLAEAVGGTIPKFVEGMNETLKLMGCQNTHFMNPHGLHHPDHWTTARDLAIMTREALQDPVISEIVSAREYERSKTNLQEPFKITSKNKLLMPGKFFYPRAIGMKTGYHSDAKHTYASVAREGNRTLIAILLGYQESDQMFRDAIRLFEAAFKEKREERLLFKKGEHLFSHPVQKRKTLLQGELDEDLSISYYPAEEPHLKVDIVWKPYHLPVEKGREIGTLQVRDDQNHLLLEAPLRAAQEVRQNFFFAVKGQIADAWNRISTLKKGLFLLLITFGGAILWLYRTQSKEKS